MTDKDDHKRHLKDVAHDAQSAVSHAYHNIDDHDSSELIKDSSSLISRLKTWLKAKYRRFKDWFSALPLSLKILYGLTVVPIAAVLLLIGVVLVKFGGPILVGVLFALKLLIVAFKLLFFIGYISYKILKTFLIWYYIITRTISGNKATKLRHEAIECKSIAISGGGASYETLTFEHPKKSMIIWYESTEYRVLFSYLRYAIVGQFGLFKHFKQDYKRYLTLWRKEDLRFVKAAWGAFAQTIFKPHLTGAQIYKGRALVLGDAQITSILRNDDETLQLTMTVSWDDWRFSLRKNLWFIQAHKTEQSDEWQVCVPVYLPPK
ncbi:MAG: hypothetical protein HOM11_08280 [Methylococcales bacterium]|jgi:hypothetical protein|nr:hypothetical protein [Methylococcales bacterium]MBT7443288.1 hypothetical protein [Methylococcales bacterium]